MPVHAGIRRKFLGLYALFLALLVSLAAAGIWFYRNQAESDRIAMRDQLVTIADFKVAQLAAWRRERLDDAVGIARDALFVGAVGAFLETGSPAARDAAVSSLRPSLREGKYSAFILVRASDGEPLFDVGAPTALSPDASQHIRQVVESQDTVFPHLEAPGDGPAVLDLYAPVIPVDAPGPVRSVLVMRMDPSQFLVPLVSLWPAPLDSAETLLVERGGDTVAFVLPPRRAGTDARPIPLSSGVPAAVAARGIEGYYDGADVRGVRVLAAIRPVPDSNWALVTKVDATEIEGPLRERALLLGTSAAALVAAAAIGVLLLVNREQGILYKRMYEEARERQAIADRFEALSRLANDTMVLADIDGRILDVNDRGLETYGYTLDEFKRMSLLDLRPPDYVPSPAENLQAVEARRGMRFETLHRRHDGTIFPVEISARLIDVDGRLFVQGMIRDISEQKRAAAQILRLNGLLEVRSRINLSIVQQRAAEPLFADVCATAVEAGGFALALIAAYDAATDSATVLASCGTATERLRQATGPIHLASDLGRGPLVNACRRGRVSTCNDIATDAEAERWRDDALAAGLRSAAAAPICEGGAVRYVLSLYAAESGYFDDQGVRALGEIGRDLSFALDSLNAERERRQFEAQFRTLFEAAPFALWVIDRATGRVINLNSSAVAQYGIDPDDPELSAWTVFSRDDLRDTTAEGTAAPLVTRHRLPDGRAIDVEIYCRPISVESRPAWFVAVADITSRRLLEEQFRQAHRMEAVGRLAGGVAHDFNNLLTAITGFAALTLGELPTDSPHRGHIEQIRKAADRAASLTRQLLAFSRRQVLQARPVDLNQSITELAKMLQRLIGEDVQLELHLAAFPATVLVDPTQIEQVLMNLAVNARDAMPRGGTLAITTATLHVPGRQGGGDGGAPLPSLQPGDYVRITVRDTGTGMSAEVQARIFEPFFTTKPTGTGTGLGLATVHGIVSQSGGHVTVDSRPGAGTLFTIYLPAIQATQREEEPAARSVGGGHETLLLVEDDDGVRELARSVLERTGYRVLEAPNGVQALERFELQVSRIDLLLTDIVMPGMSGIELAREFESLAPGLRVLFMSGYPDEALARHGLGSEPLSFLQKPFSPDGLLGAVRKALEAS
ncbi:MAG: PAS domain S-box protein [Vicinamibacterales bacterium]